MAADVIPVLDIAPLRAGEPGALERLGRELHRAFTEVGFYFVRGHGVPETLVDDVFDATRRFHALPMDAKLAMQFDNHNTGYLPMRGATTRHSQLSMKENKPNLNEAFFAKRDLHPEHPDVVARLSVLASAARARMGDSLTKTRGSDVRQPGRVP